MTYEEWCEKHGMYLVVIDGRTSVLEEMWNDAVKVGRESMHEEAMKAFLGNTSEPHSDDDAWTRMAALKP